MERFENSSSEIWLPLLHRRRWGRNVASATLLDPVDSECLVSGHRHLTGHGAGKRRVAASESVPSDRRVLPMRVHDDGLPEWIHDRALFVLDAADRLLPTCRGRR